MGTLSAGSIPGRGDFFNLNDDGGASRSDASERKARALMHMRSTEPEGAKRPRMRPQNTKAEGAKRPRMRARSAKPDGAKRPSRHAGMSAANVGSSLIPKARLSLIDSLRCPMLHKAKAKEKG